MAATDNNTTTSGFVQVADGVRLAYKQYGPPSAPNLVLIPAWAQTAASFRKQVQHFRSRFRVTTYDHRGHGESDKPAFGYRVSRLAADLEALLVQLDLRDAALLGHSMGCAVIWAHRDLFPQQQQRRVTKLVLVDQPPTMLHNPAWSADEAAGFSAVFPPQAVWEQANALAGPGGEAAMAALARTFLSPAADPADREWLLQQSLKMPLPLAAALLVDHASADWRDLIPRIDVPTLVVGAEASVCPTQGIRWTADQIPGAKIRIFGKEEGGSHFMLWEIPEEFNRVVEEFLDSS
ncbi:Alpha/Beta hydrolase protein [Biscogniauxia mediterranea]|nr:Alpha/Beta hydrolase protein [Biscogniauxia mediterranea]